MGDKDKEREDLLTAIYVGSSGSCTAERIVSVHVNIRKEFSTMRFSWRTCCC